MFAGIVFRTIMSVDVEMLLAERLLAVLAFEWEKID